MYDAASVGPCARRRHAEATPHSHRVDTRVPLRLISVVLLMLPLSGCGLDSGAPGSLSARIVIEGWPDSLPVGDTVTLRASVRDPHGNILQQPNIEWRSSQPEVLRVLTSEISDSVIVVGTSSGSAILSLRREPDAVFSETESQRQVVVADNPCLATVWALDDRTDSITARSCLLSSSRLGRRFGFFLPRQTSVVLGVGGNDFLPSILLQDSTGAPLSNEFTPESVGPNYRLLFVHAPPGHYSLVVGEPTPGIRGSFSMTSRHLDQLEAHCYLQLVVPGADFGAPFSDRCSFGTPDNGYRALGFQVIFAGIAQIQFDATPDDENVYPSAGLLQFGVPYTIDSTAGSTPGHSVVWLSSPGVGDIGVGISNAPTFVSPPTGATAVRVRLQVFK